MSINRRLADALKVLAPRAELELRDIPIDGLPFYRTDYDADYPEAGRALKNAIGDVQGLLIVTPEYNRSIPAVLKNAIDWASRPSGEGVWADKPTGVIGTSKGAISTAVAQQHLKAVLASLGVPLVGRPEAYIRFREDLIDDDARLTDASTERFLLGYLEALHTLISRYV